MGLGRVLPRPSGKDRTKGKARKGDAALVMDRLGALALGVLIGLATVTADRRLGSRLGGTALTRRERGPRRWLGLGRRTLTEFNEDRIPLVAAGATFYVLLALFPALGVFVSLYGLFADLGQAQEQIADLRGLIPDGGVSVLSDQVARLAATPPASLGLTFGLSLVLSLWSSNAGMKALISGLNVAYETSGRRGFLRLSLVSLAFTVGGIAFAMVSLATVVAVPELLARVGLETVAGISVLRWPAMLLVTAGLISLLYRFGPAHEEAHWRWITPGSVLATAAWGAMSVAFSLYVSRFGHYDATYGSLGALAGFMTWIWLSLIVVLLGAELNCELERTLGED